MINPIWIAGVAQLIEGAIEATGQHLHYVFLVFDQEDAGTNILTNISPRELVIGTLHEAAETIETDENVIAYNERKEEPLN